MGMPLLLGMGFEYIDPMVFDDPANGKRFLYWGSGFQPIKVQELAPDHMAFASGSEPVELIWPNPEEGAFPRLVEAAWVIRHDDFYYLFYSGDNCCGPQAEYGVMVARSTSPTGPFETLEQVRGVPHSLMLFKSERWLAPGHNSIMTDKAGDTWIIYHAIDVFVQSSDNEGTPNAVLEAMALETAVVATGVGGTPDLIADDVHGLLVPRRDPSALAAAIERTLDDRPATRRRVDAARRRVERELSFRTRMRSVEDIYQDLFDRRRAAVQSSTAVA